MFIPGWRKTYKHITEASYCYISCLCPYHTTSTALFLVPVTPLLSFQHPVSFYRGQHGEQDYGCTFSSPPASGQIKLCLVTHITVLLHKAAGMLLQGYQSLQRTESKAERRHLWIKNIHLEYIVKINLLSFIILQIRMAISEVQQFT